MLTGALVTGQGTVRDEACRSCVAPGCGEFFDQVAALITGFASARSAWKSKVVPGVMAAKPLVVVACRIHEMSQKFLHRPSVGPFSSIGIRTRGERLVRPLKQLAVLWCFGEIGRASCRERVWYYV